MKLDFSNLGGVRLLPYGGSGLVTYGETDDYVLTTPSKHGRVAFGYGAEGTSPYARMVVPNHSHAGRILQIDDLVYIDGANISGSSGTSTSSGGYLTTVDSSFTFDLLDNDLETVLNSETITFQSLGIVPSTYTTGLKISNLDVPNGNFATSAMWGARYEYVHAFNNNFGAVRFVTWLNDGNAPSQFPNIKITGRVKAAIGYDFYIWFSTGTLGDLT